jgi:hypothetical protein
LDAEALTPIHSSWIADSEISDFFTGADGSVFAIGSEIDCDGGARLVLWTVTDEELQVVFRDDSIRNTEGRHGLQLPDGSRLLVGVSKRVTDIARHEDRLPNPERYSSFSPKVSSSEQETSDLLILVVSPLGDLTERVVVPFGGDVFLNGLLRSGWGFTTYGGVAGQGAFIDLKVPERYLDSGDDVRN